MPYYDIHDWGIVGMSGEYIYGEDTYCDDYYMDERWKPYDDFPEYYISTKGRIWSSEFLGISISAISTALHGKTRSTKGWYFEYVNRRNRYGDC